VPRGTERQARSDLSDEQMEAIHRTDISGAYSQQARRPAEFLRNIAQAIEGFHCARVIIYECYYLV
jgi:hypothetical protein